jgi:hypothetical protein
MIYTGRKNNLGQHVICGEKKNKRKRIKHPKEKNKAAFF